LSQLASTLRTRLSDEQVRRFVCVLLY